MLKLILRIKWKNYKTLQFWKKRFLTPIGKITVVKSPLIPLFTHLFLSLPNPNSAILKKINSMFLDFIWNGKAKVKEIIITQSYAEGGLKMTNLNAFIQNLKLSWVKKLWASNGAWVSLVNFIDIEKLYYCGKDYVENLLKKCKNAFWKDVLISYQNYMVALPKNNESSILESPLLYNHEIRVGNKPFYHKDLYKNKIIMLNVILTSTGSFLSINELKSYYDINIDFLTYNNLIHSVKKMLKNRNLN